MDAFPCRGHVAIPRTSPQAVPRHERHRQLPPRLLLSGATSCAFLPFLRHRRRCLHALAGNDAMPAEVQKAEMEVEELDYLSEADEETALAAIEPTEADEETAIAAIEPTEVASSTDVIKTGRVRHADLVDPPLPDGVKGYTPGEGYGSNAIPFAGVSPKTSKRRNASNKMKVIEMLKEAKEIADRKTEERAMRKARAPSQTVPVPRDLFSELQEKGWLDALISEGLSIAVQESGKEAHHARWVQLSISGPEEEQVRAGVVRLMSLMVPRRLGSA
mmetsp:Transcript_40236/g.93176  ORF Transcript_40236/g.93176 Transcript_40236/m.93176 type:complete len:275 (-) Transcript_40236:42-866(-)